VIDEWLFESGRMNRRFFQLGCLALSGVVLSGCWRNRYSWNQKMTVTVSTPTGDMSASAVTSISVLVGKQIMTGNDKALTYFGEAVALEVKPGKYLFALIGEETKWLAQQAFGERVPEHPPDRTYDAVEGIRDTTTLSIVHYPRLVTFKKLTAPQSVELVEPNNLAKTFGEGYALKSITLEITDEPMTEGVIEKLLPWEATMRGSIGKDMKLRHDHLLNVINDGSFKLGPSK
jgi:hypothetical protein